MKTLSILTVLAVATPAAASPLADAIARHAPADVESLRGRRDDATTRCALGAVYAKRGDLSRAHLYFAGCRDVELPDDIASDVAKLSRETHRKLEDGELTRLEIVSTPTGVVVEVSALPNEIVVTPATMWVKAGNHEARATIDGVLYTKPVLAETRSRTSVIFDAEIEKKTKPVVIKDHEVSFDEEQALEKTVDGPPPDQKWKNIMSKKYLGELEPAGPTLEDPLAGYTAPRQHRAWWLGVRLGAGMFDDGAAAARVGGAVGASARFALVDRVFVAARLDWSRRGGEGAQLDTIGASAGVGATLFDRRGTALAVIGQLRGDLRLDDTRDMMPVSRAGASAAASIEVALPSTPLTAGLRFEHGLTEMAGVRDRALLLEVGVDWR